MRERKRESSLTLSAIEDGRRTRKGLKGTLVDCGGPAARERGLAWGGNLVLGEKEPGGSLFVRKESG